MRWGKGGVTPATIGRAIRERREELDMTQRDLAERAHVGRATISNAELGKAGVSPSTLVRVADVLQCTTDYLLGRTRVPEAGAFVRIGGTWVHLYPGHLYAARGVLKEGRTVADLAWGGGGRQ